MIRKSEPVHPDLSELWGSVCCLLQRWKEEGGDTWTLRVNSSFKFPPNTLRLGQEGVYRFLNRLRVNITNSVNRLLNYDPENGTGPAHLSALWGLRASYNSTRKRMGEIHELCEWIDHSNFTQTPSNVVRKESIESTTDWGYKFQIRLNDCWIMFQKREPVQRDLSALWGLARCL